MDDRIQRESFFSTGGVADPVRRMHLSKVSIPSLSSAPAERVLSVDAVMDVARAILWPETGSKKPSEGDATRAQAKKPSRCRESATFDNEEDAR